ncbi:MAG TPA: divalent metal cation transporter [Solirubrobacteraceae bacterium]
MRTLGPGIVAGASDNDPTTVATVAVVGSTTAYALGWLALLIFPMLAIVQAIAARVGAVTRRGLDELVLSRFGRGWARLFLISVLPVSVLTLAADLKAGAAALGLLSGIDLRWFIVPLGASVVALLLLGTYGQVRRVLQVVSLAFLAYVFAAFAARPDWGTVLRDSLQPSFHSGGDYTRGALALLGTTLTSYVYLWETIELSEERREQPPRRAQLDAVVGAFFVVVVFWFILVATGATLGLHHHRVQTAEDAARALRPIAGQAASVLFGAGLLASAALALPVLATTTAHLLSAERGWRRTLSARSVRDSPFYLAITATVAIGAAISFLHVSAIHLLFVASIAGAVGTPLSLVFMLLLARDRATMGAGRISRRLAGAGFAVAVAVVVFGGAALASS